MISDSASVTMLQLWPAWSSAVDMTAKPMPRAVVGLELLTAGAPGTPTVSPVTLGASALWWSMPQLKPWVIRSLWLNCFCGAHAVHGLPGWNSVAILYWSRSWYPVSIRAYNGIVWPVWVFVEATSPGGFLGSYGCSPPSTDDLYWYSKVVGFSHFG